jgi:peptidoglycan hydrolase-like protein with peptidoglycan-binding domain
MGKCLTSLVALAASLFLLDDVFADEQVRRVQEELRKRHLFYAEPDGQKGPAFTVAVKHYQAKKGFAPTGILDPVTVASLGISPSRPSAATTPVTIVKRGQVHGANGETLPDSSPFLSPTENGVNRSGPGLIGRDYIAFELRDFSWRKMQRRPGWGKSLRLTSSNGERDVPAEGAFDSAVKANDFGLTGPVWSALLSQQAAEEFGELSEIDDKRVDPAHAGHGRRTHRRSRRAEPRKEKNPLVLTYRSVDRAIRSLFGETQTKKKRSTTKRL